MNLLVIRHGQSEADILEVMEGRADFNLTDLGRKQAQLMAEWVSQRYKIDKIISSPLKRASQTAAVLSEYTGVEVAYDDDLMEWQNGLIAGLPRDEARKKYPRPEVKYPHTIVYEQESDIQFRARAETALSKIIYENPMDSIIAIVSHGGLIGKLFDSFLRLPFTGGTTWIPNGDTGIHEWQIDGNNRGIIHVNLQEHLKNLHTKS